MDISGAKIGAIGFCMGGGIAIGAAAEHAHRSAAVASFHGGNLATDAPSSPHTLVSKLAAHVYIASAENDESYPPSMAARLEAALHDAGLSYRTALYAGAAHGWMVPDFPTYDQLSADRGWEAVSSLFARTIGA